MPKRGGSRGRNWGSDDHFQHDDRGHENIRRVSFKPGFNTKKKQQARFIDRAFLDDDVSMVAGGFDSIRISSINRGRGGRLNPTSSNSGNYKHSPRRFIHGSLPWYQVVIPYGANHSKEVILNAIVQEINEQFPVFGYKIINNAAVFYVENAKIAEKLFNTDRKIMLPDGFRMILKVRNQMPIININDQLKEKMKTAMARRYNPATKALDLTRFHCDPEFEEVLCPLSRPPIMITVMNIIYENIPDLEALNLNNNHLMGFDYLKSIINKFKSLKILYLADNKIPYFSSLMPLKCLPLVELNLKGNPLVTKFNDHDSYISNVRKRFTKLVKLDETDLPPMIGFDVEESTLPPRQPSFLIDPAGLDIVRQFLTQYYAIYDSPSRQPLLDAYHENAMMSLCANYNTMSDNTPAEKLTSYIQHGRNLVRLTELHARRKNLRVGRLQVVSMLSELPATQHDLLGSSVDLMLYTPGMIVMTVNGVFRETASTYNPKPIRSFHRTLVIVPQGGGYCIQHDMLFVSNATRDQVEKAFKSVETPPPVPAAVPAPAVPAPATAGPDDAQKMQMVAAMAQQSGMNAHWSTECLQSSGWDYQRAVQVFTQMNSEAKIPPEAFVK